MIGSFLFFGGIAALIYAYNNGSPGVGFFGVILIVVGGVIFWKTSATKEYLDKNKKR